MQIGNVLANVKALQTDNNLVSGTPLKKVKCLASETRMQNGESLANGRTVQHRNTPGERRVCERSDG